jgi:predicted DNA-binding protein
VEGEIEFPPEMREAIIAAARKRGMTEDEYINEALELSLKEQGIIVKK